jgi:DNA-binding transcriptional LysR family regulator
MSLAAVNLNHLVALDALLTERSVGKAAQKLGVTQSALSHTLRSLRETTGDALLVRSGNAMVLTPFAEQAKERLQRGLAELESVVSGRAAFDPATITDCFTLATYDGIAAISAAPLLAELTGRAPNSTLRIQPIEMKDLPRQLESGDIDLVALPPVLDFQGLASEEIEASSPKLSGFSVVCRRDHPKIRKRLTLAQYCSIPHAVGSLTGDGPTFIDHLLERQGRSRRVVFRAPYMLALAEVISTSDLLLTLPTAMAEFFCARWPLQILPFPLPFEGDNLVLWWHPRFTDDPAHRFFREVVQAATRQVVEEHG